MGLERIALLLQLVCWPSDRENKSPCDSARKSEATFLEGSTSLQDLVCWPWDREEKIEVVVDTLEAKTETVNQCLNHMLWQGTNTRKAPSDTIRSTLREVLP